MVHIIEREARYYPQIIEALDGEGRTIVRASQHQAEDGWTVAINTVPRSLPDLHVVGKVGKVDPYVWNLVEVLAQVIESHGWLPIYSLP